MTVRIGAKLPHTGTAVTGPDIPGFAIALEQAGFDSLWVSDHVTQPRVIRSHYPFAADGRATWPSDTPYFETVVTLAAAAAVTRRVVLGTAVLVLPQRNPLVLAKQVASVDALSGGRVVLGVGAGWLREEFEALEMAFEGRGARMVEWMELLRSCWTGAPPAHDGPGYRLPADMLVLPAPASPVPLLVGGHSAVALRRAGALGDGWLGQQSADAFDPARLRAEVDSVHDAARQAGRDVDAVRIVLRIVGSVGALPAVARQLPALERAGVQEIVVDLDLRGGDPGADHDLLRDAAGA